MLCFIGDDADLCSELLQESLDALRALPEATLFDEGTVSSVWLEVVERATKFLRLVFTDQWLILYVVRCVGESFCNLHVLSFLGSVMYMEVPAPKATFLFRTSTWPWPSCWSWLYRGALSGNQIPLIPADLKKDKITHIGLFSIVKCKHNG